MSASGLRKRGFSLIELLIVIAIILIIAAIAIPNLLRARMAANQASGLSNLRTITTAAITYSSTYSNGYPPDLSTLGGVGLATCNGAILLDDTLTTPPYRKSGYQLSYQAQGAPIPNPPAACANPGFNAYLTTAVPLVVGQTGQTSYCSEEPGIIHYDPTGAQAASPAPAPRSLVFNSSLPNSLCLSFRHRLNQPRNELNAGRPT